MALNVKAGTEWDATVAAFCGAVLGAVAVVVHQLYVALFVDHLLADPFVYVMTEMAVLLPSGAMLFAAVAMIRNRFRHLIATSYSPPKDTQGRPRVSNIEV